MFNHLFFSSPFFAIPCTCNCSSESSIKYERLYRKCNNSFLWDIISEEKDTRRSSDFSSHFTLLDWNKEHGSCQGTRCDEVRTFITLNTTRPTTCSPPTLSISLSLSPASYSRESVWVHTLSRGKKLVYGIAACFPAWLLVSLHISFALTKWNCVYFHEWRHIFVQFWDERRLLICRSRWICRVPLTITANRQNLLYIHAWPCYESVWKHF